MQTIEGKTYSFSPPEEVLDDIQSNTYTIATVSPLALELVIDSDFLHLQVKDDSTIRIPIRTSFLRKLLRWHKMPEDLDSILYEDLFIKVINELLHKIKSWEVNIKFENGEALTITSQLYTELKDLDVYNFVKDLDIEYISKNDYMTRFYTSQLDEQAPIKDDFCGFGFDIVNSETGFSALSFNHFILRYVCTNGATAPINIFDAQKNHYNQSSNSLTEFLQKQLRRSDQSREQLIQYLKKSNDLEAKKYKYSIKSKLNFALGGWKADDFFRGFDWESSKYDLFNFVTDKAKSYDIIKRYQLERIAGELILN